jgi:hypothetical protein
MLAVVDLPCTPHGSHRPPCPNSKHLVNPNNTERNDETVHGGTGSHPRCALKLNYICTMTLLTGRLSLRDAMAHPTLRRSQIALRHDLSPGGYLPCEL